MYNINQNHTDREKICVNVIVATEFCKAPKTRISFSEYLRTTKISKHKKMYSMAKKKDVFENVKKQEEECKLASVSISL